MSAVHSGTPSGGPRLSPEVPSTGSPASLGLAMAKIGVYVIDAQWRVVSVEDPLALLSSTARLAQPGQSLWEADRDLAESDLGIALRRAVEDGTISDARLSGLGVDRWIRVSAAVHDDLITVCCRDVTEDRRVLDQLADRTRRLRRKAALLDVARDAIFVQEMDSTISYWNRGAASLYGLSPEDARGSSARTVLQLGPDDFEAAVTELRRTGQWSGELTQTSADGRVWTAECRWQLGRDDRGDPSFILCVVTDVTDLKQEREALYRAQRMDSLGTLAGGMAHDLNNVLTPILLSTQLLASEEADPLRLSLLESIQTSAERGADMIRQVLSFARGEESRRRLLDVGELLDQLTSFCAEVLPKSITVTTHAPRDLPLVSGDNTQLLQVLMNFVTNARDAMPTGGRLTVTARSTTVDLVHSVTIAVQDTGSGMSEKILAKVFEPFFTTKPAESGTGLGLSTSIAIARGHGGDLSAESTLGKGSRFTLRLPASVAIAPLRDSEVSSPRPRLKGTGERVLVIDDESTIRTIVQHSLEANGYEVFGAGDGVEAIMLLEAADDPIDLVITDMMMPVMDGAAVAAYLFEHHPGIALIAASGVTATEETVRAAHLGVDHFLAKPFSTDDLLRSVRDALDARPAVPESVARPGRQDEASGSPRAEPLDRHEPRIRADIDSAFERERLRVAAVRGLKLIGTPPEERFERITDLARKIFRVPVAQITLVDAHDQYAVSGQVPGQSPFTVREDTLCEVTVEGPDILVVPDASEDPRFEARGTVAGERHIRFYAGRPLLLPEGHAVGALCLIDTAPRHLSAHERALLEEMGRWAERELAIATGAIAAVEVQHSLEPLDRIGRRDFDVAGVRMPAQNANGTFYDWHDGDDGSFVFTVVEVIGAGEGGAIIAASIRSAFQARTHLSPLRAVEGVQAQLGPDLEATGTSAAVFHARFDTSTEVVEYIDAGYGLSVRVRPTGEVVGLLPSGLPLGIPSAAGWMEHSTDLTPGDSLVSVTAGFLDLFEADGVPVDVVGGFTRREDTAHDIVARIRCAAEHLPFTADVTAIALTRPVDPPR